MRWLAWLLLMLVPAPPQPELPVFTDITKQSGINFKQSYGDHHLDNIVEGTGTGVCVFDYNNDGYPDIFFPNGAWTKGVSDNEGRDLREKLSAHLYKNNGDGTFTDVTEQAGVGAKVFVSGCSAADYDNDGHVDLYLLAYGPNILYHNNGDGTFTDVSEKSGLADPRWSLSAVWFDYNNDGYLDVYVGNYLKYDDGKFRDFYPAQGYPGPLSYSGEPSILYRNNGDGTFTDVTKATGMWQAEGRAMSVTAADMNNDGALDIYVANDAMEKYYFEATGKGTFEEKALERGLAYGENGQGVASMGPVASDFNRDGLLDFFVPDLNYCSLLMQVKLGVFEHRTEQAKLSVIMGQYSSWAPVVIDYDNDGWPDIFITHGNAHHEYTQEDTLVRNKGNGTFEDVSTTSGQFFNEKYVGRGAAYGDLDNDGDEDIVVVNLNDYAKVLRNDGGNKQNWLSIEPMLKFATGTRNAIGARVTVSSNGIRQIEDVQPVRGYLSQNDVRLHFGLAKAATAEVQIRWPDGHVDTMKDVKADQFLKPVREAKAIAIRSSR
jgi:hypothetical protein